ncbi:PilZ domain-containing protein [Sinorhizobium sp. BG8]|uniref:PilZ domain-containing protein n=1 Tax=Sinorhizobium sp. BG8 TaxID=2613773 RepID=UPI00193DC0B8|nr:PilZ domain-containing protein [Sinorhizobium sp. BG8]QRM54800.1 PilZ domain-containing protein [Sinorhizobium sp. BG8]
MSDLVKHSPGAGLYERKWERFAVNRQAVLLTVGLDLAFPKIRSCQLIDISLGSATFSVGTTIGLSTHYYLSVVGIAAKIGCAEVFRNGHRINVQFIKEIDADLLHSIVRSDYFTGGISGKKMEGARPYMVGVEKASVGSAVV